MQFCIAEESRLIRFFSAWSKIWIAGFILAHHFFIKADTIPEKHKTVWDLHELEAALKNTRENQYQVLIRKIVGELEADNENFIYYTEFFSCF